MNKKKIKSLIVAGLLMVGMCGNVFANEVELPKVGTAVIENPAFEEGKRVVSLQDGLITVTITENEDGTFTIALTYTQVDWEAGSDKVESLLAMEWVVTLAAE